METAPPTILDELHAVLPKDFTRTRDAKVAELRKAGRVDAAEAVRRLRRPPVTLWATNQLARLEPERLVALIDAVADLRRAQVRDPRAAGEALRRQRAELDALVEAARKHLVASGFKATQGALTKISNTLQGAAVDRQRAQDLRHGRLTEELAAPGFEVFAGTRPGRLRVLPGGQPAAADEHHARQEEARQRRAREAEERRRLASERKVATEVASREVQELRRKLEEARRRLSKARRRSSRT